MAKIEDQYHLKQSDDPDIRKDENANQDPQQWHTPHQTTRPQPPRESTWRRLWRMWSPFFIKLGISYLVSLVISTGLLVAALMARSGYDYAAAQALLEDEAAVTVITNEVMQQLTDYTVPIEGLAALITIPVLLFLFRRDRSREKLAGIVPKAKAPAVQYLIVIAMGAALCIGLNGLFMISGLSFSDESYVEAMETMYSPSLPMQLICLGLLTPACEELTYRGLIFKRVREGGSFVMAAIYSALIFAIMHGYLVEVIYAFIMGFVFSWFYEKYGSVLAPVAAHMTANIVSVLATYFNWFDWLLDSRIRIGLTIVVCAAVASSMYVLIRRLEEPEEAEEQNNQNT